jgi:hypothetical protein
LTRTVCIAYRARPDVAEDDAERAEGQRRDTGTVVAVGVVLATRQFCRARTRRLAQAFERRRTTRYFEADRKAVLERARWKADRDPKAVREGGLRRIEFGWTIRRSDGWFGRSGRRRRCRYRGVGADSDLERQLGQAARPAAAALVG